MGSYPHLCGPEGFSQEQIVALAEKGEMGQNAAYMENQPAISLSEERGNILVVDSQLFKDSSCPLLKKMGYPVFSAGTVEEGRILLAKIPVAVILCSDDLAEPLFSLAEEQSPLSRRILLCDKSNLKKGIRWVNEGMSDQLIIKPVKNRELTRSVELSLEKYKLLRENNILQQLILSQHQQLKKAHENLQSELDLSAKIHERLLVESAPKEIEGLEISAASLPSKDVDGDFFAFYPQAPHVLDFAIGDVMGKGIAAALVGTAVKTQLNRFAVPPRKTIVWSGKGQWKQELPSPEEVIASVQQELADSLIDLEYFVSLFYGRFDLKRQELTFVDLGSPKPLHYRKKEGKVATLEGEHPPLGVLREERFIEKTVPFEPGDLFLFYSDGVTEARTDRYELFGEERVIRLLEKQGELHPDELVRLIITAALSFSSKEAIEDDVTLIAVKILEDFRPAASLAKKTEYRSDLEQLPLVRQFVERFCQYTPGNGERFAELVKLAINEIFCNIVKHGYRGDHKEKILIFWEMEAEGIRVRFADRGIPFNPSEVEEPDFSGGEEGGFGWHLIRKIVDEISYSPKGADHGWNHLTIFKRYQKKEESMDLAHHLSGKVLIVTPHTESLDARDTTEFKEQMISLISSQNVNSVILDLSSLNFIDSSGLGSFLSVLKVLNEKGGDLKLTGMNRQVRMMFELVKMHKVFEIFNSSEDAISSFKP